jgi:hypothetical protein
LKRGTKRDWATKGWWRRGKAKRDQTTKREFMAVSTNGGTSLNHLGHTTLGCAMNALKSPNEEGCPIRGSVACGKGKVPKEVKGGGADAPTNLNAKWKESVSLGSGNGKPFEVFLPSSLIIRSARCLGTFDAVTS